MQTPSVKREEDSKMFEVKVFNKYGELVKVYSPKSLIERYWKKFEEEKLKWEI